MKVMRVSKAQPSLSALKKWVEHLENSGLDTIPLIRKRSNHYFLYRTLDPMYDVIQKNYAKGSDSDLASKSIPCNAIGVSGLVSEVDASLLFRVDYSGGKPRLTAYEGD